MKTILVPVDFSEVNERVADAALALAQAFKSKVVSLHVTEPQPAVIAMEPGPVAVDVPAEVDERTEHERLAALRQKFASRGIEAVDSVAAGSAVEKILEESKRQKADVIVMGS